MNDAAIARFPQVSTNLGLDLPFFKEEVSKALKQMSVGKAPGSDAISAEIYKSTSSKEREITSPVIITEVNVSCQ